MAKALFGLAADPLDAVQQRESCERSGIGGRRTVEEENQAQEQDGANGDPGSVALPERLRRRRSGLDQHTLEWRRRSIEGKKEDMIDLLGLLAGALTTIAFVPQLLKLYATKSGKDVSARMFLIFSTGVMLWLVYGILIRSAPITIANSLTLLMSLIILALKLRYSRPQQRVNPGTELP